MMAEQLREVVELTTHLAVPDDLGAAVRPVIVRPLATGSSMLPPVCEAWVFGQARVFGRINAGLFDRRLSTPALSPASSTPGSTGGADGNDARHSCGMSWWDFCFRM